MRRPFYSNRNRTAYSRDGAHYKDWKYLVLERDHYKCQHCGSGEKLVAHHVVPWDESIDLRFDLNNGLTLCMGCHAKHHKNALGKKHKGKDPRTGKKTGKSYWKGKKFSDEHRKKIGLASQGRKWTQEQKIKLSFCKSEKSILENRLRYKGKTWRLDPSTGKRVWHDKQ